MIRRHVIWQHVIRQVRERVRGLRGRVVLAIGLLAGIPAAAPAAWAAPAPSCAPVLLARLTLRDDGGYLSVPALVAGRPFSLLVDTGAEGGLIDGAVAAALALPVDMQRRTILQGTGGGGAVVPDIVIPDLRLGTARTGLLALGALSVPVGALPGQPMIVPPVAGLLGSDVLARFDVEFDGPGGRLSLWRAPAGGCTPAPAWRGAYTELPAARLGQRLTVTVVLDGVRLTALVDSGARSRILSQAAAARLGVTADRLAVDPGGEASGVDGRPVLYHWHRFGSLRVGEGVERAPVLTVLPLHEPVDMLLGADWFARHAVWLSYGAGRVFVRPAP